MHEVEYLNNMSLNNICSSILCTNLSTEEKIKTSEIYKNNFCISIKLALNGQ